MIVSRSSIMPYGAAQIYQLVADIESYPQFLNWCSQVNVHEKNENGVVATMKVAYGAIKLDLKTRNTNLENQSIQMQLVEGPFSDFDGKWSFDSLGDNGCKVSLNMNFTFSDSMMSKLFGKVFETIMAAQMKAFETRAKTIYGKAN